MFLIVNFCNQNLVQKVWIDYTKKYIYSEGYDIVIKAIVKAHYDIALLKLCDYLLT